MVRDMTITDVIQLVTEECFRCHVLFALTRPHRQRLLDHPGTSFWCPNGHSQVYTGKSAAQTANDRAERAERNAASIGEDLRVERAGHSITKGKLTKARNRADKGVCQHCQRCFVNVARHVKSQHPDAT